MKIGFVFDDSLDKTDGVQQYILTLGDWLERAGHEVHYLVGESYRKDLAHLHSLSKNLKITFNRNRLSIPLPAKRARLRELLQREHFDVLHIQVPYSPWLAGRIIKAAPSSTAIIGTFHILPFSLIEKAGARLLGLYLKNNSRRFDQIFSVSPAARDFAKSAFGLKSEVLPNVIDLAKFRVNVPKPSPDTLRLVFLGRLVERKGCMELLRAIHLLTSHSNPPTFKLDIYGRGPLEAKLKQYVRGHGLSGMVEFHGFIDEADKPTALSADIAIFPALGGESFGIVLLEAMAAGAGVVLAGDNPGYRSVLSITPEVLVDAKNTRNFATKLLQFMQDKMFRFSVHTKQQVHVKQFDVGRVGQQLVSEYERAIAKRSTKKDN